MLRWEVVIISAISRWRKTFICKGLMVRLYTDIFKVFSGLSSNNKNTNKIVNSIFILPDILISVDRTLAAGL